MAQPRTPAKKRQEQQAGQQRAAGHMLVAEIIPLAHGDAARPAGPLAELVQALCIQDGPQRRRREQLGVGHASTGVSTLDRHPSVEHKRRAFQLP